MTRTDLTNPTPLQFSYPIEVARLRGTVGLDFDITPNADEEAKLVAMFAALRLSKVRFKGSIQPFGKNEWQVNGHLGATIVQPCVVTLKPVTTRIEADVRRLFVHEIETGDDVEIDAESDTDLELLGAFIDLGSIATEELALGVPEYPRAAGADLDSMIAGSVSGSDNDDKPFDALRSLRDRLSDS